MRRLHYLATPLVLWFFFLYNIERLIEPMNLAPFLYVYTALCAVLVIALPHGKRLTLGGLIIITEIVYLAIKRQLGDELAGPLLSTTLTEMSAVAITVWVSHLIGMRLEYLQETLTSLAVGQINEEVQSFDSGQGLIYREIRRARRYGRPLALLAVAAAGEPRKGQHNNGAEPLPLQRFAGEMQREFLRRYLLTQLANLLVETLDDSAIITQRAGHFVILLPEIGDEQLAELRKQLERAAEEKINLKLRIGASTFPDRAVTFERLLEQAEAQMMNKRQPAQEAVPILSKGMEKLPTGIEHLSSS
jgi:hypothetical protein